MQKVIITVRNGMIEQIEGIPKDTQIEVRSYDAPEFLPVSHASLRKDCQGMTYSYEHWGLKEVVPDSENGPR
jgi:hypothetical protein